MKIRCKGASHCYPSCRATSRARCPGSRIATRTLSLQVGDTYRRSTLSGRRSPSHWWRTTRSTWTRRPSRRSGTCCCSTTGRCWLLTRVAASPRSSVAAERAPASRSRTDRVKALIRANTHAWAVNWDDALRTSVPTHRCSLPVSIFPSIHAAPILLYHPRTFRQRHEPRRRSVLALCLMHYSPGEQPQQYLVLGRGGW